MIEFVFNSGWDWRWGVVALVTVTVAGSLWGMIYAFEDDHRRGK